MDPCCHWTTHSSTLIKLSHEPYCQLVPYWPWSDHHGPHPSRSFQAIESARTKTFNWNQAEKSISIQKCESNCKPKLSFGIDTILSDRLGARTSSDPTPVHRFCCLFDSRSENQDVLHQEQQEKLRQKPHPKHQQQSNHRKRSWSRAVFSNLQRKGLEKRFQLQKYITKPDRRQLAATLGLTDAQVKVWFQNRRMKWRHTKEKEIAHSEVISNIDSVKKT